MSCAAGPDIKEDGLVLALDAANTKSILSAVEVLVVAGGGAGGGYGGNDGAGGGGAGGLIYNSNFAVTPGTQLTATVGSGGAGVGGAIRGTNGNNSVFSSLTAIGGGGGGTEGVARVGKDGGSGGGAGGYGVKSGGLGTAGQGFVGGDCTGPGDGGGGGAGAVGQNGLTGTGGIGLLFNISGTPTYYAGGGGASGDKRNARGGGGALGGIGGGGKGQDATNSTPPENGSHNTGGGGGAAAGSNPTYGAGTTLTSGAGGSGIVIVRYQGSQRASGGTVTFVAGHTIHTFTTSGTFTPNGAPGTGTICTDFSNNGNSGTLTNGPTYSSTNGGSLVFDGTDDYIRISSASYLNSLGSSDFTVSMWVYRATNPPSGNGEILYQSATLDNGFVICISNVGFRVEVRDNQSTNNTVGAVSNIFTAGIWNNVVLTKQETTYTGYSQGISRGSFTSYQDVGTNSGFVDIGRVSWWGQSHWEGNIAQVSIYNRALTPQEIQQNFNATRSRFSI